MQKTIYISGMSCMGCANKLETEIKKLKGITQANVNFAKESLSITYDNIELGEIYKVVESLGFKIVEKDIKKVMLNVEGMSCMGCVASLEKELSKQEGVLEVVVNLVGGKCVVSYNEKISLKQIIKVIESLGFKVSNQEIQENDENQKNLKKMLLRLISIGIFTIPLFLIAMLPMINENILPSIINEQQNPKNYALVQMILTIPVMCIGYKFYLNGFKLLFKMRPNMDSLIAISTLSAFLYSLYNTILIFKENMSHSHSLYYETVCVIIFLVSFGKYLESISKNKTYDAIKTLIGLCPKEATILSGEKEKVVSIDEIEKGDIVLVKAGEKIAIDGVIIYGKASIDESMLTGESIPRFKKEQDEVFAGTINQDGYIKIKATKVYKESVLYSIIKIVEEAQGTKAPIAKIADVVSGYFVPVVIGIALISSFLWFLDGKSLEFCLKIFTSVLVIACPCTLGLATPTAIMVATGKCAEKGILIKTGEALEMAHKIDAIALDKTGTITEGKPIVTDIFSIDEKEESLLKLASSIEQYSEHILAKAIVDKAKELKIELEEAKDIDIVMGKGIKATINDKDIIVGNRAMMQKYSIDIENLENQYKLMSTQGKTVIYVAKDYNVKGIVALADSIKQTSKQAIDNLKKMGLEVCMMTGDNEKVGKFIAKETGIDKVYSEILPNEKALYIENMQKEGKTVAMVGDGINDAPALTKANVSFAIGSGTDVAIETADIVLIKNDLLDVVKAIELSKKTIKNIKQNLFLAFIYNIIGIPIACGVLYNFNGLLLNPMICAFAMSLSSVCVILNALRLKKA